MAYIAPRYSPDGDSPLASMTATSSGAPMLGVKRGQSPDGEPEDETNQRPRRESQLVNNLGISGNSRVVNVLRDHITRNNDGLAPEMYAALESIEQRLRVVHSQELDDRVNGWLSAPDVSQNFNAALEKRQPGTGTWLLDGAEFSEWKEQPNIVLCIYGSPGCGKTVLCASIIEHVKGSFVTGVSGCAYFFFDNRNANKGLLIYENFLRSVLAQLCSRCGGTPGVVNAMFQVHGNGREQPSISPTNLCLYNYAFIPFQ